MARPVNEAVKVAAQSHWLSIPAKRRSVAKVMARLDGEGLTTSKSTLSRWVNEWKREVTCEGAKDDIEHIAEVAMKEPKALPPLPDGVIPLELSDLFGARVAALSANRGLTEAEDVIAHLARSISAKAEGIVEDLRANPEAAKGLFAGVGFLSNAAHVVVQARSITAESHRAFAEGDRALAEAELARASAEKMRAEAKLAVNHARSNGAKMIDADADDDAEAEAQAFAALRGMVKQ